MALNNPLALRFGIMIPSDRLAGTYAEDREVLELTTEAGSIAVALTNLAELQTKTKVRREDEDYWDEGEEQETAARGICTTSVKPFMLRFARVRTAGARCQWKYDERLDVLVVGHEYRSALVPVAATEHAPEYITKTAVDREEEDHPDDLPWPWS